MEFKDIEGKTIAKATHMKVKGYDDEPWLRLEFSDGTHCYLSAEYGGYTGESEDEYPASIGIGQSAPDNLVPCEDDGGERGRE